MKKRLKNYLLYIDNINIAQLSADQKESLRKDMLVQISFFQHERLVHLIVTMTFAILTTLSFLGCLAWPNIFPFLLVWLFTALLIPYIIHYYTLENGVQKLYKYYDKIKEPQEVAPNGSV